MKYSHNEYQPEPNETWMWTSFIYSFNEIYGMKSTWRVLLCIEVTTIEIEIGTIPLSAQNSKQLLFPVAASIYYHLLYF